jgi:hypothetical protein
MACTVSLGEGKRLLNENGTGSRAKFGVDIGEQFENANIEVWTWKCKTWR